MECSNWLNIIGLLLNIIGFIFILINGLPTKYIDPRYKRARPYSVFEERNMSTEIHHNHRDRKNNRIKYWAWLGIVLNIIGLSLQVLANCL